MKNLRTLLAACAVVFAVGAAIAGSFTLQAPTAAGGGIRYCCTPQQSAACAAQGGTTSCRTNVCQCLF
jgi:hypothetical protein